MLEELRAHLVHIGLSEKEALVYLTLLEVGCARPNELTEKTALPRSTIYLALSQLENRGLSSRLEKDGVSFAVAEHPDRLARYVHRTVEQVEESRRRMENCLPHLLALFNNIKTAPRIRFFEGAEALQAAREEMLCTRDPSWEVCAVDEHMHQVSNIKMIERLKLAERTRGGKLLLALKPGCQAPPSNNDTFDIRFMDYEACPFTGSLTVAGNKLCVITPHTNGLGVLIDSQDIATTFRALFLAAWKLAKPHQT